MNLRIIVSSSSTKNEDEYQTLFNGSAAVVMNTVGISEAKPVN